MYSCTGPVVTALAGTVTSAAEGTTLERDDPKTGSRIFSTSVKTESGGGTALMVWALPWLLYFCTTGMLSSVKVLNLHDRRQRVTIQLFVCLFADKFCIWQECAGATAALTMQYHAMYCSYCYGATLQHVHDLELHSSCQEADTMHELLVALSLIKLSSPICHTKGLNVGTSSAHRTSAVTVFIGIYHACCVLCRVC